jgi:uncharacterized alkaline shock family protein YloU
MTDVAELLHIVTDHVEAMSKASGENPAYRLHGKKPVRLSVNKKENVLAVSVYIEVTLGTNIPQTAWDIQKGIEKKLSPNLDSLLLGKINITIESVVDGK